MLFLNYVPPEWIWVTITLFTLILCNEDHPSVYSCLSQVIVIERFCKNPTSVLYIFVNLF